MLCPFVPGPLLRPCHILTALCAAVGVVLQCGFFGGRLNLAALQYFTLMSNILCAVYFAGAAVRTLRRGDTWLPVCKGALVMAMAITGHHLPPVPGRRGL